MSTPNKPLVHCAECEKGNHDHCLKIPGEVTCDCPVCWNDTQDRLNRHAADSEKKIHGAKNSPPPQADKTPPRKPVAKKMEVHPRLRVRIAHIGPGGAFDGGGKGV